MSTVVIFIFELLNYLSFSFNPFDTIEQFNIFLNLWPSHGMREMEAWQKLYQY